MLRIGMVVFVACALSSCIPQSDGYVRKGLTNLDTAEFTEHGALAIFIRSDQGICSSFSIKMIKDGDYFDIHTLAGEDSLDGKNSRGFAILPEGEYMPFALVCQQYKMQIIHQIFDWSLREEPPKSTPIINVKAGKVLDAGHWKIVQTGKIESSLPGIIPATLVGGIQYNLPSEEDVKALKSKYAYINSEIIVWEPKFVWQKFSPRDVEQDQLRRAVNAGYQESAR